MSQSKPKSKLSVNGASKKEVPVKGTSSKAKKEGSSEKKKSYKSDANPSKEDDKNSKSIKEKNGIAQPAKAAPSTKTDLNGDNKKPSSKASSKTSERTKDTEKKVREEPPQDDYEEYAYEDDFEEYGSDFEDDFEDEVPPAAPAPVKVSNGHHVEEKPASVKPALDGEDVASESLLLQRLSKPRSAAQSIPADTFSTTKEAKSPRISSAQRRFAFEHSKEVDLEAYRKVKERFQQLKELIGLETVHSVVTNIPAIRDYEFYMQTFGKGDRSQVACQTGEDNVDVNCQTDTPESDAAWTQHPPSEDVGFGRENDSAGQPETLRRPHRATPALGTSGERFARFSAVVSELMTKILTPIEDTTQNLAMPYRTKLAFSTGFADFSVSPVAKEVRVNVVLPAADTNVLRVAFYATKSDNYLIRNRSIVADFSVSDASSPIRAFVCEGEALALSANTDAVFAGTREGHCVVWDLYEQQHAGSTVQVPWADTPEGISLALPSYDTSYGPLVERIQLTNNDTPIISLTVVSASSDSVSQRLIALADDCTATVWSIVGNLRGQTFDSDLGQRPGSRITLNKLSTVNFGSTYRIPRITSVEFPHMSNSDFLVGTTLGGVLRLERTFAVSHQYSAELRGVCDVLSLRMSPFDPNVFAVGTSDGQVLVFEKDTSEPLLRLMEPSIVQFPVGHVEWSPSSPQVLYSVHASEHIVEWDVTSASKPAHVSEIQTEVKSTIRSTAAWSTGSAHVLALGLSNGHSILYALESSERSPLTGSLSDLIKG